MVRNRRCLVAGALASLGLLLSACSSNDGSPPAGPAVGPSYVHGDFQGILSNQLIKTFSPMTWSGQTDGPVLVSAEKLLTLSDEQKIALIQVLTGGHAILVSEVTRDHLARIHDIHKRPPVVSLDEADSAAVYVLQLPAGRLRVLIVKSVPEDGDPSDVDARKADYAKRVAEWFLEQRRLHESGAALTALTRSNHLTDGVAELSPEAFPWSVTSIFSMPAWYSNSCNAKRSCTDTVSVTLSSWSVYDPWPIPGQPSDYIIGQLSASVLTAGCKLAIGSDNRFAGYWLRQFNLGANVKDVTLGGYRILDGAQLMNGQYAPITPNPDGTYTKGVTFSLTGSGTIGGSAEKGAEGSVGFSAGVSYSNTSTISLPTIVVTPKIPDVVNPTKALWTYDSWNHVNSNIKPFNHACGGPGLDVGKALLTNIYGGTFSPNQEWVWAFRPEVRAKLPIANGFSMLPVEFDASMLLGWAYFWQAVSYCDTSVANGRLDTPFHLGGKYIDIVGTTLAQPSGTSSQNSWHSDGLAFDPGCGTEVNFGTIPLGDPASGKQDGTNVGPPFRFGTIRVDLPLAADPNPMTLTSIEPTSGLQGQVITLRGTSLNTATSVNFGGQPAPSWSMQWDPGQEPVLKVPAPMRIVPTGIAVQVSVSNAVKTTQDFQFTYTN